MSHKKKAASPPFIFISQRDKEANRKENNLDLEVINSKVFECFRFESEVSCCRNYCRGCFAGIGIRIRVCVDWKWRSRRVIAIITIPPIGGTGRWLGSNPGSRLRVRRPFIGRRLRCFEGTRSRRTRIRHTRRSLPLRFRVWRRKFRCGKLPLNVLINVSPWLGFF